MKFLVFTLLVVCTSAGKNRHITGGTDADVANFPWMVSLQAFQSHLCGGVLINDVAGNPNYVVTSAFCIYRQTAESLSALIGTSYQSDWSGEGVRYNVTNIKLHELYNNGAGLRPNDVAVVQLGAEARGERIAAATLESGATNHTGAMCTITGWGDSGQGQFADTLQRKEAVLMTNEACSNFNYTGHQPGYILPTHTCAMVTEDYVGGTCDGDNGGPITCPTQIVVGLSSWWLSANCNERAPNVFTRISSYRNWLNANTPVPDRSGP